MAAVVSAPSASGSSASSRSWGTWVRYGLTAGGSFVAGVVVLALAAAEVRQNAKIGADLAPRVSSLEAERSAILEAARALERIGGRVTTLEAHEAEDRAGAAADRATANATKALVDEVRQDVKTLLRRSSEK